MTVLELRKELGLTRVELSRLTGVPSNTIKDWECGWHEPKEWVKPMFEMYAREQYKRYKKGEIEINKGG